MDNVKPVVMTHFASLYWISAILLTGVTISHGGTKVIAPKISALNLLELTEKYKVIFALLHIYLLLKLIKQKSRLLSPSCQTPTPTASPVSHQRLYQNTTSPHYTPSS